MDLAPEMVGMVSRGDGDGGMVSRGDGDGGMVSVGVEC